MPYKIAIADDDLAASRAIYQRLLGKDTEYESPVWLKTAKQFRDSQLESFDVLLLDVNLDGWEMSLGDALRLVGSRCAVILVSQHWGDDKTEDRIRQVMALAKETNIIQVLILNDLAEAGFEKRIYAISAQLKLAVARERLQAALSLRPDDSINILHLSDSQYGDPGTDGWASMVEDEVVAMVRHVIDEVHFIAITGDITYSGKPVQFEVAKRRLDSLIHAFLPAREDRRERLLLVPGNHDVNLELTAADRVQFQFSARDVKRCKPNSDQHRPFGLQPFRDFAWRVSGDPRWIDDKELCWHSDSFRHLGLRLFYVNSVSAIGWDNPDKAAFSEVMQGRLKGLPDQQERLFGLALAHHGPESFRSADATAWQNVSKFLQTCRVHLLLHGHGHARKAERLTLNSGRRVKASPELAESEFVRVMAPTTHLNGRLRPRGERRGFNIVRLHRSGGMVDRVQVTTYRASDVKPKQVEESFTVRIPF